LIERLDLFWPSSTPTIEDDRINVLKRSLAHNVPMIIGPAPDFGVEFSNQIDSRPAKRSFDRFSDPFQEGLDVFLGRLDEQFTFRVSAHVLSEEIKAFFHERDDRLRGTHCVVPRASTLKHWAIASSHRRRTAADDSPRPSFL
jgi:hypothetical protein